MGPTRTTSSRRRTLLAIPLTGVIAGALSIVLMGQVGQPDAQEIPGPRGDTSYSPVVITSADFDEAVERMSAEKDEIMARQRDLLEMRYDLSDRPMAEATMSGGKPVQDGVRVRLPEGVDSWDQLNEMSAEEIREQGLFPRGFLPLPHPNHPEGGMVFPDHHIEDILEQEGRDLERFDLEFDLPEHLLPEFPPPMFLTTRPDLGDVSQGQLVTIKNFQDLFEGILNSKQLEGMRLLVTPFPQQQFNSTHDRRSLEPHQGVTCFDCHANGHTNASTHLAGDPRPQETRRRIDTPTLRGMNVQMIFGSQRAMKSAEDFTEFEQRGAYFDGDIVQAAKKGVNMLERGSQVHFMGEVQNILGFPPAPKLDPMGYLRPELATEQELAGEELFHGTAQCATCHPPPHFTDNSMHDLQVYRFHDAVEINGRLAVQEGLTKTFPLRGIKDSPTYFHDGRLLTLADTVEFFNLILELGLAEDEKEALVAYMLTL